MTLTTRLKEQARELGFGLVGVASVEASAHMDLYREWVGDGRHGEMGYLAREDAVARRADLRGTLPTVRSAVVVGHEYFQDQWGATCYLDSWGLSLVPYLPVPAGT